MSVDWVRDIAEMHQKYGVHEWVLNNPEKLEQLLHFRVAFLKEEFDETFKATGEKDAEEIVDGLIDLCVVAIGTLDIFGIDSHKAWSTVHKANMSKEVGVKESRPNPLGLPDLIKPEGWTAPSHTGNHGLLNNI
jgi:predicted HAD superfamily Cof-like phosphohydrolase